MNATVMVKIKELCCRCHVHLMNDEWDYAQELVDELCDLGVLEFDDTQEMMEWIRRVAIELHMN